MISVHRNNTVQAYALPAEELVFAQKLVSGLDSHGSAVRFYVS